MYMTTCIQLVIINGCTEDEIYSPEHGTIVTLQTKTECTLNTMQLEHVY